MEVSHENQGSLSLPSAASHLLGHDMTRNKRRLSDDYWYLLDCIQSTSAFNFGVFPQLVTTLFFDSARLHVIMGCTIGRLNQGI